MGLENHVFTVGLEVHAAGKVKAAAFTGREEPRNFEFSEQSPLQTHLQQQACKVEPAAAWQAHSCLGESSVKKDLSPQLMIEAF